MCDPNATPDVGSPLVFVGVAMSAVATIAGNAGLNMQKWGFLIEAKKPAKDRVHFVKMWKWWGGFILVLLGAIMDFVSYGLAPSSIVTPVGSLTLVVNIFLAHWWLGESIYMQDYVGTFFIVAGATMTVVFGNQSESCLPVSELAARYATTSMIVYMACAVAVVAAMYVLQRRAEGVLKRVVRLYQDGRTSGAASDTVEIEVGSEEPASPVVSPSGTAEGWIASSLRDVGWISDPPAGAAVAPAPRSPREGQAMRRSRAISGHVRCIDDIIPAEPAATIVPSEAIPKGRSGSHHTASPTAAAAASGQRGLATRPPAVAVPRDREAETDPPADGPDSKLSVLAQNGASAPAIGNTSVAAGASPTAPEDKHTSKGDSPEEESSVVSPSDSQHVVDPPSAYEPYAQWHPVSVSVLAGTLGAQTVLFAKSVAETIKTTAGGDSQLDQPAPYLFLLALIFFIVVQQMWLAHALRFFDAAFVVPVFQGTYIAVSVLGGVAYFQELNGLSTVNLVMFPISVLVVLFGVYVLSTRKMGGMRAQLFKDADEEEEKKSDAKTGTSTPSPNTPALSAPAASTTRKHAAPAPAVPKLIAPMRVQGKPATGRPQPGASADVPRRPEMDAASTMGGRASAAANPPTRHGRLPSSKSSPSLRPLGDQPLPAIGASMSTQGVPGLGIAAPGGEGADSTLGGRGSSGSRRRRVLRRASAMAVLPPSRPGSQRLSPPLDHHLVQMHPPAPARGAVAGPASAARAAAAAAGTGAGAAVPALPPTHLTVRSGSGQSSHHTWEATMTPRAGDLRPGAGATVLAAAGQLVNTPPPSEGVGTIASGKASGWQPNSPLSAEVTTGPGNSTAWHGRAPARPVRGKLTQAPGEEGGQDNDDDAGSMGAGSPFLPPPAASMPPRTESMRESRRGRSLLQQAAATKPLRRDGARPHAGRGALRVDWFVTAAGARADLLADHDGHVRVWRRSQDGPSPRRAKLFAYQLGALRAEAAGHSQQAEGLRAAAEDLAKEERGSQDARPRAGTAGSAGLAAPGPAAPAEASVPSVSGSNTDPARA